MTLNERMSMLQTKFNEKNEGIHNDLEMSNEEYTRMLVNEAYQSSEQALALKQRILNMEQNQLQSTPNPYSPDFMQFTHESMAKNKGVNSLLEMMNKSNERISKSDEFETKRNISLARLGLEKFQNQELRQRQQYEKEKFAKKLLTQANINTVDDAVNDFGASLLGKEDPMNYGFWDNVGANTVEFLGDLSKGLAVGVKGLGDVVETSGRLASRALPWSEDDPTLHRPEDGEGFVANMKMLGRRVAKDWQTSVENDQLTKPFQEALNWGGNKLLEAKRDMRAESINTLEDLKRQWDQGGILPIEALSTFLGMAGESFINPETAAVIATGPLGWGAKAAAFAGVATSKASEMALDRREAEARMSGLPTNGLYKDQIGLNEFLAQTPYALGYAGLNYLEINGLFKLMGSNFVPKNFLKADIKQVADYALKRLPAEEMEAIAKTGFKSAAENAWSLNKLNPFIRKAAEQAPEIVGFGGLVKHIGKQAIKGTVGLAGKAAVRAVPAGALEGGVEYLQTHLELANARPDLSDSEKEKLAREAGISGALVGGAIGGTAGVARGAVQSSYNFTKDSVDNAKHIKSKEANRQTAQELAGMSDVKATTRTDNRTPEVQSALDTIEKYTEDLEDVNNVKVKEIAEALSIIGQTNNVDRLSENTQEVIRNTVNKALELKNAANNQERIARFKTFSALEKVIMSNHLGDPKFIEQFIKRDYSTYGTSNSRVNNAEDDVTEKNYKKFLDLVKTVEESGVLFTKSQANAVRLMASEVKNNILRGYSNEGVSNTSNDVFMFGRTDTKNVKPSMIQYLNALMSKATSKEAIVNIKNRLNSFKVSHANKLKLARYAKNYTFKDTDGDVITVSIPKLNPNGTIQKTQGQVNKKDVQDSHIFHIHRQAVKNKFIQSIDSELERELNAIQTMEELANERLGTATTTKAETKQEVKDKPIVKKPSSDEKKQEEVVSTKKEQENVKAQPTKNKETEVNKDAETDEVPFEEDEISKPSATSDTQVEQEKTDKDSLVNSSKEIKNKEKPTVENSNIVIGKDVEEAKKLAKEGKGLDAEEVYEEETDSDENYTPILENILPEEEIAGAVRQQAKIDTKEADEIIKLHEHFKDVVNPEGRFQAKFSKGKEALEKFFGKAYTDLTMKLRNIIPMQDSDHNLLNYTDSGGHIRIANAIHLLEDERARASVLFRSLEWLMSSPMNFTNDYFETREAIQKLFGVDEVPQHIIKELQRGEFESSILENLGHKVLNDLGIKPLEDKISQEQLSLVEQEIGLYGVRLLLSEGYITQHSFSRSEIDPNAENTEANITYYKLGRKKIREDMLKRSKDSNIYKEFLELADALKTEDIVVSSYLTEAPEKNFKHRTYIKGRGVVPITDVQVDALNTIEQTPFVPLAKEKLTELTNNASFIKILKKALGYKYIVNNEGNDNYTDPNYILPSELDSVRGKNLEIDNSIEHLQNYLNSEDSNNPIYFKAFMSKNSRYFLASSTINPQANKLHRFFVVPKQAMQTYEIKDGRVDDVFYQSMAQAFGFSTDKKSTKEAIAFGEDLVNKMLKMDEQARLDRVLDILQRPEKYSLNNTKIEIENPSHAIMGLFAINDLANAIAEGKSSFDTVLTNEIDAINNGLILKTMQYASGPEIVDNLAAGGVVFGTTDTTRINDRYAQGENDLYKLFAKKITELKDQFVPDFGLAFQFLKTPESKVFEQVINKITPELTRDLQEAFTLTDEGNVSSKARSLVKPTSTVFGYGSGDKSSVLNLVNELIYGGLRGVKSLPRLAFEYVYQGNKEGEAAYNLFRDMLLETAVANSGKSSLSPTQVQAIENEIKKALVSDKGIMEYKYTFKVPKKNGGEYTKTTTLGHALKAIYYSILKNPLIGALDSMYPGMSGINDLINTAVNSRLEAQNELYAKKKQEELDRTGKKTLTIEEDKKIWEEVEKVLPKPFFYFQPKSYKGTNAKVEMWDTKKVINPNFSQTLGVMRINGVDTKSNFKYVSKTLNGKEKQRTDVGASANVGMIHQADGVAMANTLNNKATKDMGLLPIHDAVSVSSKNAKEANQVFNKVSYEDSMERDVLEQAVTMARGTEVYSVPTKWGKQVEHLGDNLERAHYVSMFNKILLQNASVNYDNIQNGIEGSEYSEVKTIDSVEELKSLMATFNYYGDSESIHDLDEKLPKAIEYFKSKGKDDVVAKLERINRKVNKTTVTEKVSKEATKQDLDDATKEVKEIFSNSDPEVLNSYIEQTTKDTLGTSNTQRTLFRDDEVLIEDFDGNVEKIYEAQNTVRELDKLDGVHDEEHSKHLDQVLKEVVGVNPEAMKGLKVALENSEANENEGLYDLSNNKINISSGTNTLRTSPSREETYAHEIIHAMTVMGLKISGLNSRVGQYLKTIHKQAIARLTVENFLPEVSSGNFEEDMKIAKRDYNYFKNNDERGLSEFITMGLTNKKLVAKLKSIEFIQRENRKQGMNLFERMVEGVKDLMANAFNLITKGVGRNKSLYDTLLSASMKIANANNKAKAAKAQRISTVGALIKGVIETGNERINAKVEEFIKDLVENKLVLNVDTNPKTWFGKIKLIAAAQTLGALDSDTRERYYKLLDRLNIARYGDSLQTLSQDFHKPDKFGRTVEQFIATSNRIDAAKMVERVAVTKALKEGFKTEPTKEQSQALGKAVIDTDLESLMDRYTLDDVYRIISSETEMNKEIKTLKDELQEAVRADTNLAKVPTKEFMTYVENQTNGLAYYMVTNKVALDGQFLNAENIAKMGETKYATNKTSEKTVDLIDKLITLKALKMSDTVTPTLKSMLKNEREGIQKLLTFIGNYKQDADRKLFKNSSFNKVKGYRPEKLDNSTDFLIARVADEQELKTEGYEPISEALLKDDTDSFSAPRRFYRNTWISSQPTWNKAAVKLTSLQSKGHTLADLYVDDLVKGKNVSQEDYEKTLKNTTAKHKASLAKMFTQEFTIGAKQDISLLPIVDATGHFQQFRYVMSKALKTTVLGLDTDVFENLAIMESTKFDKVKTAEHNAEIADAIYEYWEEHQGKKNLTPFVELSKYSTNKRMRDIYRILPDSFLDRLKERFAGRPIMIRKDMTNWLFGFRDIDVSKTKPVQMIQNKHFRMAFKIGDALVKKLTKVAKAEVVVKSVKTITSNIISNLNQCIMQGCTPSQAFKDHLEGINALSEYRDNAIRLKVLKNKKKMGERINEAEYNNLKRSLNNSPVKDMIEWGMFSSIVEDIEYNDTKDAFDTKIDKFRDKLPKPLKVGTDMLFITKETTMYQTLAKVLQYSDFVSRYALKKGLEAQGIQDKELIRDTIRDAFINYDLPMSPLRTALEQRGFFVFSKFFTRIQKVLTHDILGKKPIQGLFGILVNSKLGTGLETPFDSSVITKNYDVLMSNPAEMVVNAVTPAGLNYIPK